MLRRIDAAHVELAHVRQQILVELPSLDLAVGEDLLQVVVQIGQRLVLIDAGEPAVFEEHLAVAHREHNTLGIRALDDGVEQRRLLVEIVGAEEQYACQTIPLPASDPCAPCRWRSMRIAARATKITAKDTAVVMVPSA